MRWTLNGRDSIIFDSTAYLSSRAQYRHLVEVAEDALLVHRQFTYSLEGNQEKLVSNLFLTGYEEDSDAPQRWNPNWVMGHIPQVYQVLSSRIWNHHIQFQAI